MKLSKLYAESADRAASFVRLWGVVAILHATLAACPGPIVVRILNGLVTVCFGIGSWLEYDNGRLHRKLSEAHERNGT